MKEKREKTVTSEGKKGFIFFFNLVFYHFIKTCFQSIFCHFLQWLLWLYTQKYRENWKKLYVQFSFSFFWSAQNFSYCSWPYFLHSGGNNWLSNPFEWLDFVSSFKIGVLEPIVSSRVKEISSRTVRKILSTPKKEKKNWTYCFFKFYRYFCV